MQFSGLQVTAWVLVLMGTGCLIGSLLTDFWSTHHPQQSIDNLRMHRGLFKQCTTTVHMSTCNYRFTSAINKINNYVDLGFTQRSASYHQKPLQNFEVIALLTFLFAHAFAAVVLVCGPYCCTKWGRCTCYLILLLALCTTLGCAVYAYYNRKGYTFTLRETFYQDVFNYDFGSDVNNLSWSFWLAATAAVLYWTAFALALRAKPTERYETVSVV